MSGNKSGDGLPSRNGTIKTLAIGPTNYINPAHVALAGVEGRSICSYTPFIPLQYLEKLGMIIPTTVFTQNFTVDNLKSIFGERSVDLSIFPEQKIVENKRKMMESKMASLIFRFLSVELANRVSCYDFIKSSLSFDDPQSFSAIDSAISNNTRQMHDVFNRWGIHNYTLRSCNGTIGNYLISTMDDITRELHYHIMPVILPGNLAYQRMHILLYGSVDLEYVIFLVDEELESPSFPIKGLQTMYKGRLKLALLETAGQIVYVPKEFITDNCFISPFKLTARSIEKRKKEKESIVRMYLEVVRTGRSIDWSKYYDHEKDLPPYTGPLVPPTEPTSMVFDRLTEVAMEGRAVNSSIVDTIGALGTLVDLAAAQMTEIRELSGISARNLGQDDVLTLEEEDGPMEEVHSWDTVGLQQNENGEPILPF